MSAKRLYYGLLLLTGILIAGLFGGTYAVNTMLTHRAGSLIQAKAQSAALDQREVDLRKAQGDIKKYAGLQKITGSIVPEDKNQAQAVREINSLAARNDIDLSSITFPASTLGTGTGAATITPGAIPKATPNPGLVSGSSKANALSQLLAVPAIPGVYSLQITVQSNAQTPVPFGRIQTFLASLENNRRTAQVTAITLQAPDPREPNELGFTLTINEYIEP